MPSIRKDGFIVFIVYLDLDIIKRVDGVGLEFSRSDFYLFSFSLFAEFFVFVAFLFLVTSGLIVMIRDEMAVFLFYCARIFSFFICIRLFKLYFQQLTILKCGKMTLNVKNKTMINILSMYIRMNVLFVFTNTFLGLNINVVGWMLKYCIFIWIIYSTMFIVLQVSSFFNTWVVNEEICVLNDVLKDLLFYSMIFVFISIDKTRIAIQVTARTTKIHNILLWVGGKVHAINANILNKSSKCNIDNLNKRKTERETKRTQQKREAKNREKKKQVRKSNVE